jgi:hypothetical protein
MVMEVADPQSKKKLQPFIFNVLALKTGIF